MRDIKFRGYAVDKLVGSQWVYGFGVDKVNYTDGTSDVILYTDSSPIRVLEDSVGQYSCVNDSNKTEVYEGDIITGDTYGDDYCLIIKWDEEYTGFYCHDPKGDEDDHLRIEEASKGKVIGNKIDNPELLSK
jgi:hypothetical protein